MEYRHEVITFGDSIPIKCFVHQLGYSARHWHNSMELLFVLEGSVRIGIANNTYMLDVNDTILINSNEPHELVAEHCVLAAIQIKLSMFDEKVINATSLCFDCNSKTRPNDPGIRKIKRIIAQFIRAYAVGGEASLLQAKSLSYALLSDLFTYFKVDRSEPEQNQTRYQYERITRIAGYINEHYSENITLQAIAEQEFLSLPYLSKFFVKAMGVNFTTYLNSLRLTHAIAALTGTKQTIESIAAEHGFPNTQAFVQLFKKKYGMLPSRYRKQDHSGESQKESNEHGCFNEYTILDSHRYLDHFVAFLDDDLPVDAPESMLPVHTTRHTLHTAIEGKPLRHSWRSFTSVGSARLLLLHSVQEMLRNLQKDVGFRYIKFHGIFSDDMHVVTRDGNGTLHYSFVWVDQALDFLLSIGLKPLIQLSFMPAALAMDADHVIFESTMINSPPADIGMWCELVERLTLHLLDKYGKPEVESWPFTVWNEPDTPPRSMFGFPSDESFYAFYLATWKTVKACDPALSVASPSTYIDPVEGGTWLRNFTGWCDEHDCLPDCILFHYYGTTITYSMVEERGKEIGQGHISLTTDDRLLHKCIEMTQSFVRASYPAGTKVCMTEWNYSPSYRDLLGDTCFRSCYLVKNILENYDQLDAMGYWMLTDLFEEHQIPAETFHGGLGLWTSNGIKKAAYYALCLLAKLGDTLLASGDGYFLTRKDHCYQLMLYNYSHYSDLYAAGETFGVTMTKRNTPFESARRRDFEIQLAGMEQDNWRVTEYTLNQQSGSSFDKWVEMGAQPLETPEETELLQSLSMPMMNKYIAEAKAGVLTVNALLEPLEVRLILLRPEMRLKI